MNDELSRYYELLGVTPGVSIQELKTAHRDLAKVWHPDRFAHDPRLQQKAQEKLKEINEAFDLLASGKAGRRTRVSPAPNPSSTPPPKSARRISWKFILPPVLAFLVLFFAASRALIPSGMPRGQNTVSPTEQAEPPLSEDRQQGDKARISPADESPRSKRVDQQPAREARPSNEPAFEEGKREVRPLPTVTVTIDPVSGGLATPACPVKSRMTYPSGAEPSQYCNIQHKSALPEQEAEQVRPKESRLKSFARRLASPTKIFGGKERKDAGSGQEVRSPEATSH